MATYRSGALFGRIPAAGKPQFSYRFKANSILRLTDEITGKFRGGAFQRALEAAHIEAAENIQRVSRQQLTTRKSSRPFMRWDHEPGALEMAIMSPKNRFVNASGFKVGIPSWLDSDESHVKRYWRQIEQGAPERQVRGYFWFPRGPHRARPDRAGVHARFFESSYIRAPRVNLGPFPAYRYGEAGALFARFQHMLPIYQKHLAPLGLTMSQVKRKPR